MAVNRFMTPAQMPQTFSPYVMPFEQMAKGLAVAEAEYAQAEQGLYDAADTDFAYIKEVPTNQLEYDRIIEGIQADVDRVVGLSGNGDLRKIGNEVTNLNRSLKRRTTSQTGDIYRMASDAQRLKAWDEEESQKEMAKTNPQLYQFARQAALAKLEAAGGSLKSSFSQENLIAEANFSQLANDKYAKDIEARIIEQATSKIKGAYFIEDISQAYTILTQEEIGKIVSDFFEGDPTVTNHLDQLVRIGYLDPESRSFYTTQEVIDDKGNKSVNYLFNASNPAWGAIKGAMNKYDKNNVKTSYGIKTDSALVGLYTRELDNATSAFAIDGTPFSVSGTGTFAQQYAPTVNALNEAIKGNDWQTAGRLYNEMTNGLGFKYAETAVLNNPQLAKNIKALYSQMNSKGQLKDKNGNTVSQEDFQRAIIISSLNTDKLSAGQSFQSALESMTGAQGQKYDFRNTPLLDKFLSHFGAISGTFSSAAGTGGGPNRPRPMSLGSGIEEINNFLNSNSSKVNDAIPNTTIPITWSLQGKPWDDIEKSLKSLHGAGMYLANSDGKDFASGASFNSYLANKGLTVSKYVLSSPINGEKAFEAIVVDKDGISVGKIPVIVGTNMTESRAAQDLWDQANRLVYNSASQHGENQAILNQQLVRWAPQLPNATYRNAPDPNNPKPFDIMLNLNNRNYKLKYQLTSKNDLGEDIYTVNINDPLSRELYGFVENELLKEGFTAQEVQNFFSFGSQNNSSAALKLSKIESIINKGIQDKKINF